MDKQIHPVGSKLRVTKDHDVTWLTPWPKEGDVLSVVGNYPTPHSFGYDATIYVTKNGAGQRVLVREDYVEPVVEDIPEGTLVFVKETHTAKEGRYLKVYAGDHLTVVEFSKGSDYVTDHYWGVDAAGDYRALLPDKIALVESAPEKLTPPRAPNYVGRHGAVVYHEEGNEYEGYWKYNTYWGWSNFVASNPELYREPKTGEDMQVNGTLAKK